MPSMDGLPHDHGDLPFGYMANGVNGIGLPPYAQAASRPQHSSQPILSEQNNVALNDFLNAFEQPQSDYNMDNMFLTDHSTQMPPSYQGFESVVYDRNGQEIHEYQMESFLHNNVLPHTDVHSIPRLGGASHYPYMSPSGPNFGLPTPVHSHSYQQQPYQPQGQPLPTPGRGPVPNFGSDNQFSARGYQPAPPQIETNSMHDPQWLSSGPSTRPNTQPSSPVMSRKRKSEASHEPSRNGLISPQGQSVKSPVRPTHSRKHSLLSHFKTEPIQEPTPNSLEDADSDADAQAESDNEYPSRSRTTSPVHPWPSNRPRLSAQTSNNTTTPAAKSKRKTSKTKTKPEAATSSKATPARPKAAKRRSSSVTTTQAGASAASRRQPLTQEQKKANHTSSEQRRRDAAAAALARVFDLVPEARNPATKSSTVERLKVSNAYIERLQQVKAELSAALQSTSVDDQSFGLGLNFGGGLDTATIDSTDTAAAGTLAEMVGLSGGVMFGQHPVDHY